MNAIDVLIAFIQLAAILVGVGALARAVREAEGARHELRREQSMRLARARMRRSS